MTTRPASDLLPAMNNYGLCAMEIDDFSAVPGRHWRALNQFPWQPVDQPGPARPHDRRGVGHHRAQEGRVLAMLAHELRKAGAMAAPSPAAATAPTAAAN